MAKQYLADKETQDKIYNILKPQETWGFVENMDILSPTEKVIPMGANENYTNVSLNSDGTMALNGWADFFVIQANKPYMVKSDGAPDYRLNENDYTLKEDGTASDVANTEYDGGAFSWIPRIYKSERMVGNKRFVSFSAIERDGYEPIGFIDGADVLEGAFIPMFYSVEIDGKFKSISGAHGTAGKTTTQEYGLIKAFSERAEFLGGGLVETIIDLLIMMAGTTNLQEAYGYGNSSGYNSSDTTNYGKLANAIVGGGQFYGTKDKKSLNKIFHSIVLGTYNMWIRDPYEVIKNGTVHVSRDYTYDLTADSYLDTGINAVVASAGWKYIKRYQTVPGYGSAPDANTADMGASTSLGACDGTYCRADLTQTVALRFGHCTYGSTAGLRARVWSNASGIANWHIAAALLLKPPVGVAA